MPQLSSAHILRFTLGLTFIFVSVMIFQEPIVWAGFIDPWAVKLIPISLTALMTFTAVLDLVIGLLLIINRFVWVTALVSALHLLGVLIASVIDTVTVRDIGLLGAAAALMFMTPPPKFLKPVPADIQQAPDLQSLIKSEQEETL